MAYYTYCRYQLSSISLQFFLSLSQHYDSSIYNSLLISSPVSCTKAIGCRCFWRARLATALFASKQKTRRTRELAVRQQPLLLLCVPFQQLVSQHTLKAIQCVARPPQSSSKRAVPPSYHYQHHHQDQQRRQYHIIVSSFAAAAPHSSWKAPAFGSILPFSLSRSLLYHTAAAATRSSSLSSTSATTTTSTTTTAAAQYRHCSN